MTQDIQAELRMIREIQSWLRNEERFREEILGVSPSGPGQSGQAPEPASRLGHSETVPNALRNDLRWLADNAGFLTVRKNDGEIIDVALVATLALINMFPVNVPLRGRIA
jgi:hypothetical protein